MIGGQKKIAESFDDVFCNHIRQTDSNRSVCPDELHIRVMNCTSTPLIFHQPFRETYSSPSET